MCISLRWTEILEQRGNSKATDLRKHDEEMTLMSDRGTRNEGQKDKERGKEDH